MTPSQTGKLELQRVWSTSSSPRCSSDTGPTTATTGASRPRSRAESRPGHAAEPRPADDRRAASAQPALSLQRECDLYQARYASPGATSSSSGVDYTDNWFGRQYPTARPRSGAGRRVFTRGVWSYRLRPSNGFANCRVAAGATTPCRIEVWNNPAVGQGGHPLLRHVSHRQLDGRTRLTLNLGVRFAHDNGFVPESLPGRRGVSGGRRLPGRLLRQAAVQRLEQRRAATARVVGHRRQRQDGAEGRLGTVRPRAAAGAGNGLRPTGRCGRRPLTGGAISTATASTMPASPT